MDIRIRNNQRTKNLATASLKKRLGTLLRSIGLPDAELSILFIGDRAMRALNRRYRDQDKTTDVLSFSLREGRFTHIQPDMLGDIVISVPAAARQARGGGQSLAAELDRLLVHGLAHLLGYDHERGREEARRMKRKEHQLLKRLSP
ncbi:MAG TPA: rRNA maturation RNase YbeY [Nitrospirota bacterium]